MPSTKNELNDRAITYVKTVIEEADVGHERVAAYLSSRGLTIEAPAELGFLEEDNYRDKDFGPLALPTMVAIFQDAQGEPVAVFRTYLDPVGDGKADVPWPKKFSSAVRKGATMGGAVRLFEEGPVMVVTEGVETALAVHQATGLPVWATCSANRLEKVVIPDVAQEVQIWADNDSNGVGQNAAQKLAERLHGEGHHVRVIIPPEEDTDWLDVLNTDGEGALCEALSTSSLFESPAQGLTNTANNVRCKTKTFSRELDRSGNPVEELNKLHFVVSIKGHTYIATEMMNPQTGYVNMELGRVQDFQLRYANWQIEVGKKKIPAAQIWLNSPERREYDGVVFAPGKDVPRFYNLWVGFAVKPKRGDCSLYWDHLKKIICRGDEVHYQYVRKWMAHMIQRPAELPEVALVIRGKQGTGKNMMVGPLGKLLGSHYLMLSRMDQVTGRFTGHLKDGLLVFANEAIWGGDKQGEGVLKSMITDDQCTIEAKGKDSYQVQNFKRVIIASNEQWAAPMGMDDRRFLVLEVSDDHKEDKPYFAALAKQMEGDGLQALLYDLQHEDLSDFDVRTKPYSSYGFEIKLRGAEPFVRWWYERLHEGTLGCVSDGLEDPDCWDQTPAKSKVHENFLAYCEKYHLRTLDKVPFGKWLHRVLAGCSFSDTKKNGKWCHVFPTLAECRAAFEHFAKSGPEIWA